MRPPSIFWVFNSSSPAPQGPMADGPHRGRGHVGRHCPYTNNIWCGSVHALLRYRSKTVKMQKAPLTPIVTKISFAPFSARRGPQTPKRKEVTSRPSLRSHANFGVNRPAGCWEIVDRTKTNKQTNKTYSKTNTSLFALTSEWRVKICHYRASNPEPKPAVAILSHRASASRAIDGRACAHVTDC